VSSLEVQRDAQIKQSVASAEQAFAERCKKNHENCGLPAWALPAEIYEVKQKVRGCHKENLGYRVLPIKKKFAALKVILKKIIQAERTKLCTQGIQKDLDALRTGQRQEEPRSKKQGDTKFEDDLNNLKLKGERDLALGKEKSSFDVNARYKKNCWKKT